MDREQSGHDNFVVWANDASVQSDNDSSRSSSTTAMVNLRTADNHTMGFGRNLAFEHWFVPDSTGAGFHLLFVSLGSGPL